MGTKKTEKKPKPTTAEGITQGEKKKRTRRKGGDPWKEKMVERLEKISRAVFKAQKFCDQARPPVKLGALQGAATALVSLTEAISNIPEDWRPARSAGKGLEAGTVVMLTDDAGGAYNSTGGPGAYNGAVIKHPAEFDPKYLVVLCTDGITRVVRKKHVTPFKQ